MHCEFIDDTLNGYLSVSKGSDKHFKNHVFNYYTLIWNKKIPKKCEINNVPVELPLDSIIPLSPGHTLSVCQQEKDCIVIQFSREFYCIKDPEHEALYNGILFNGALSMPLLTLDENEQRSFSVLLDVIKEEFQKKDEAQLDLVKTVLKRIIIKCTRLAKHQYAGKLINGVKRDLVRDFNALVEANFRTLHKVSDYAHLMNKSPKTLANVFKISNQKTPLKIIHDRIILEAKKLLLYTEKSAKEISYELNFSDPIHFSRFFKRNTGLTISDFKGNSILSKVYFKK